MTLSNGIHVLSRLEYEAIEGRANFSALRELATLSPAHMQQAMNEAKDETAAMRIGTLLHTLLLEPGIFNQVVVLWEGDKVKEAKRWREFKETHAGKDILSVDEYAQIVGMRDAILGYGPARRYLELPGKPEAAVLWTDSETGIHCKGRLDLLTGPAIVDVKSCGRSVKLESFRRTAYDMRYYMQAAMYVDGVEAVTGKRPKYIIIAVESFKPFAVAVYVVGEPMLAQGRKEYRALLAQYAECTTKNEFPTYYTEEVDLDFPSWVATNEDTEIAKPFGITINHKK